MCVSCIACPASCKLACCGGECCPVAKFEVRFCLWNLEEMPSCLFPKAVKCLGLALFVSDVSALYRVVDN